MPRTNLHNHNFNALEQLFAGKVQIERASGYFYYQKDSPYSEILQDIKYRNQPKLARWMMAQYAMELKPLGIFDNIDFVVPVPLHPIKLHKRGYNQTHFIGHGITDVTSIPMKDCLSARFDHGSQTRKGMYERWLNTQDLYVLKPNISYLKGKHLLLIDDVATTGATLIACAQELSKIENIKISILTLAVARL